MPKKDSSTIRSMDAQFHKNNISSDNLIEDILTSIENMSKSSLSSLAISHGIKVTAKLSLDHLKKYYQIIFAMVVA